ncbi:diguanylate cyclase domain-containing protein [Laspinema olomoucense]|uniref:diguanylate cyclase domain-containing protein n=1 Tax=Laspinema olomoucense TaxID=3231600 RepID=UPI0021BB2587|nr:diguanylate cyclase [Laspinema sp. D3c]MCT7993387.1 diguanylate cyclase [Laspinema sp. D3c]
MMNQRSASNPKANVLVVDDTPVNLLLLNQILCRNNYKIRVAPNGKMALKSVMANPPDLILLDIKMPDMDGYEVCRQLKADPRTEEIPIIFISALDGAIDKVTAFNLGGVDYITKPFEPVEVLARIEHQLRLRELMVELKSQNAQLQLLLTTTQSISEAGDIDSALAIILEKLCQTLGWDFGEAWMPNDSATELVYGQAWYGNDAKLAEFHDSSKTQEIFQGRGFAARIWQEQDLKWIADASQEESELFSRADIVATAGLKGMLGIPILLRDSTTGNNSEVLAVLVFFQKDEMQPDRRSLELLQAVASQLGSMIQRKKTEAALKKANLELERLAHLDSLTQVANRRRFDEYLDCEWNRAQREKQPLSLILFDLDYFKAYNDYYGHQAGDRCLQQVARSAGSAISRKTDLLARYGGEEFVIILPNTNGSGALKVAETIRVRLKQLQVPHLDSLVSPWVTVSLGIGTTIPTDSEKPESLIAVADAALYEAKSQGRDRAMLKALLPDP